MSLDRKQTSAIPDLTATGMVGSHRPPLVRMLPMPTLPPTKSSNIMGQLLKAIKSAVVCGSRR